MDYVKPSVTGLAKTVWRELDWAQSMEVKSYQQQLSECYQQQDKKMEMTEKGLERLTAICRQLGVRRGRSWLIFQEWKRRELALIHFLICAGFPEQKAQMGGEGKKKKKKVGLAGSRDCCLSSTRELWLSADLQASLLLQDHS